MNKKIVLYNEILSIIELSSKFLRFKSNKTTKHIATNPRCAIDTYESILNLLKTVQAA